MRRRLARPLALLAAATVAAGLVTAGVLAPAALGAGTVLDGAGTTAERTPAAAAALLDPAAMPGVTTLLDRTGAPLATLYEQYRVPVDPDHLAPAMAAAIVAIEDRRFFTEGGVDPQGLARAALHDLSGGAVQGGSTITQQYVKNYLIDVTDRDDPAAQAADRADSVARKVREAVLAQRLATTLSKRDVLAGYLDVVAFTGRIYGVGAAARAYFGTTADRLTVPQAALLAGMVNNPTRYDPYARPDQALARRDVVIAAMREAGSLSPADAAAATAAPLGVLPGGPRVPGSTCVSADAGFFCAFVQSFLARAGLPPEALATGGYTVRTTLDPAAQGAVQAAVDHNVPQRQDGVANTFALIRPGPTDHQVLAMAANRRLGPDTAAGETLTNIVAGPSNVFGAGSTFKIFTTAAALEAGVVGYDSTLPDPDSACVPTGRGAPCYPVHNDSAGSPDPISLPDALATSPNVAFVELEQQVGVPAVVRMAQRLGLRDTMASNAAGGAPDPGSADPRYSLAQSDYDQGLASFTLGVTPVSTLEMANVSATILSDGTWCPPDPVLSVTDRTGADVPLAVPPCEQAVAPGLARTLAAGLGRDSVDGTTADAARAAGWHRPDIGKTGTTNASESVAFVGGVGSGTGGLAAASMVFADGPHPRELCPGPPVHLGSCGHGAFGGTVAAPPYFAALTPLLAGHPDQPLPGPDPAYRTPRAR